MKNKKAFILIAVVAIVSLTGIFAFTPDYSAESSDLTKLVSPTDSTETKTYTCSMHPEVISDKPGECPKCGMDLILKENDTKKGKKKDAGKKEHEDNNNSKNGHNHSGCKQKGC